MPIEYTIDHECRLVRARALGTLTDADVFGYQLAVWSRPDVAGYDELIDMSEVEHIAIPSAGKVQELAALSARLDRGASPTRFAFVAPGDHAYGLGRMYQVYRGLEGQGKKEVRVFRTMAGALAFLGIERETKATTQR
jgi:hypothetical protein